MEELSVIKIGGNVIDKPEFLAIFLKDFQKIKGAKILIHGGGVLASSMAKKMGVETKMHQGRRITDLETLKIVTMVYAGWINKSITAQLQSYGCNSIGLSGADANTISATKRNPEPIDFGFVGDVDPDNINIDFLSILLENGLAPIFSAITHDQNGNLLNTNADTIASSIAIAMGKRYRVKLIYCFEKEGVLLNPDDDSSLIALIDKQKYVELKSGGVITDGMIPKLDNSFKALEKGVAEVYIKNAKNLNVDKQTLLCIKNPLNY